MTPAKYYKGKRIVKSIMLSMNNEAIVIKRHIVTILDLLVNLGGLRQALFSISSLLVMVFTQSGAYL